MKRVNIVLQKLLDDNDSIEFIQPVDWKYLGLTDYPLIVKNPIDLGSIKKNYRLVSINIYKKSCKIYI